MKYQVFCSCFLYMTLLKKSEESLEQTEAFFDKTGFQETVLI